MEPRLVGHAGRKEGRPEGQELRPEIQVYEEIRVWIATYDAADRRATGEPVPEEIQQLLGNLIASATPTSSSRPLT